MSWNKSIGGYFGLEGFCQKVGGNPFASYGLLNSGRNAFEFLLKKFDIKFIQLPFFTCDALLQPLIQNKIDFSFYHLDREFRPVDIDVNQWLVYVNYFGLNSNVVHDLDSKLDKLLIDNSQALYSKVGKKRFYSPRKFLGLPDGGMFCCINEDFDLDHLEIDYSFNRFEHLLKRVDVSAEAGYEAFVNNEKQIAQLPLKRMSRITTQLIENSNHSLIAEQRRANYISLHKTLREFNNLSLELQTDDVPMVYPFLAGDIDTTALRQKLIGEKIYVATYWPEVATRKGLKEDSNEVNWVNKLLPLPIDQRMDQQDVIRLAQQVKEHL